MGEVKAHGRGHARLEKETCTDGMGRARQGRGTPR